MHSSGIFIDLQQSGQLYDSSQLSENVSSSLENVAILAIRSSGLTIYQDSGLSHLYQDGPSDIKNTHETHISYRKEKQ